MTTVAKDMGSLRAFEAVVSLRHKGRLHSRTNTGRL